jgi:hypothetical protein
MVKVEDYEHRRFCVPHPLFRKIIIVFGPYISSDSHHPNPTQMERIYRAFLFQEFPSVEDDVFSLLVEISRKC